MEKNRYKKRCYKNFSCPVVKVGVKSLENEFRNTSFSLKAVLNSKDLGHYIDEDISSIEELQYLCGNWEYNINELSKKTNEFNVIASGYDRSFPFNLYKY